MICSKVDFKGRIKTEIPNNSGKCENLVLINQNEFEFSYAQITALEILTDVSWGFGIVVFFWSFGFAIGAVKTVISKM